MANQLRSRLKQSMGGRRMVMDMALKHDAIYDPEFFTQIVMKERPRSYLGLLFGLFGNSVGISENGSDPNIELRTVGIGSNFIKIKEICYRKEPLMVTDSSRVPETILANSIVHFSAKGPTQDIDELLQFRDEKTTARVQSARPSGNYTVDYSVQFNGLPGESFPGWLLSQNSYIEYGIGNSKGEASQNSNLLSTDAKMSNIFFNPMTTTRYKIVRTGDYESDEFYIGTTALDGSTEEEFNTGITKQFAIKVMEAIEAQIWKSTANFDPNTYEISGRNTNSSYPERATYAGIWQQLDNCAFTFTSQLRATPKAALDKINRILQLLYQIPGQTATKFAVVGSGPGIQWVRDAFMYALNSTQGIRITYTPDANDKIVAGFAVEKYVDQYANSLYIVDTTRYQTMQWTPFDKVSKNGITGGPRSRDLFFIPITSNNPQGMQSEIATYFTKEGKGHSETAKLNRGLVIVNSEGITGRVGGMTGQQMQNLQEEGLARAIALRGSTVTSLVDADETHILYQGCPYLRTELICKLHLE